MNDWLKFFVAVFSSGNENTRRLAGLCEKLGYWARTREPALTSDVNASRDLKSDPDRKSLSVDVVLTDCTDADFAIGVSSLLSPFSKGMHHLMAEAFFLQLSICAYINKINMN
jgi:hypothetical protein